MPGEQTTAGEPGAGALVPLIERLLDEVGGLRRDFDAKIRYDAAKEQHIARMSQELEDYRTGLHRRLLQPVFTDLIAMYDDLTEALGVDPSRRDRAAVESTETLGSLRDSIVETLSRNGVFRFTTELDEVDRSRQKVIEVVSTPDQELDRRVARRLRAGFEHDDGKVLRPEWVAAYRYRPVRESA